MSLREFSEQSSASVSSSPLCEDDVVLLPLLRGGESSGDLMKAECGVIKLSIKLSWFQRPWLPANCMEYEAICGQWIRL